MNEPILVAESPNDATAVLTLNRPQKRNALNIELLQAICENISTLEGDRSRRVVILRGAGPVFCAGLDLTEAADEGLAEQSAQRVAQTFQTIQQSSLVTIAAVHGASYAGGAGVMAACDFVVASDDLQVCFPEVRRGLVPALVSVVLRSRVRDSELRELLLLAEPIDARRAANVGLVDRIVPASDLLHEAHRIADSIRRGAPGAIRLTKQLLHESRLAHVSNLFSSAVDLHSQARHSDEAKEGLRAFHERREPNWR